MARQVMHTEFWWGILLENIYLKTEKELEDYIKMDNIGKDNGTDSAFVQWYC
jgi:hypothetical protein